MNRRRFLPISSRKQIFHTLLICMVGVIFTSGVALVELAFLNVINKIMVQDLSNPAPLIQFLQQERDWIFYGLSGVLTCTIIATFILSIRFTNKIFGPEFSMIRDLKKQTFLGQLRTDMSVRKDDHLRNLISAYRDSGEVLERVHRLYSDAYEEIDHSLEALENEKKSA
jgi:hypothetical protein